MSHTSLAISEILSHNCDSYSTARSENFPSIASLPSNDALHDKNFVKVLQDQIKVMKARTTALYHENVHLKTQIHQERMTSKNLEERLDQMKEYKNIGECKNEWTNTEMRPEEMTIKVPFTCHACSKTIVNDDNDDDGDPMVFITKTELNNLEKDIKELRESLQLRENSWDGMVEREQNYSRQLTRLAQEIMTVNQLVENQSNDIENLSTLLQAREGELKSAQKDIIGLQKLVVRLEKRNKALKENGGEKTMTEMNERDRKWIETIVRQVSTPRGRQKSKESYYSTPRSVKNSGRDETTTIIDT